MKDGEAEWYHNVSVKYVGGRKAVLTIYDGDEEKEKVTLSDYKEKDEMHAMMIEKGFTKKSDEEIEQVKLDIEKRKAEEAAERERKREERRKLQEQRRKEKEEAAMKEAEEKAAADANEAAAPGDSEQKSSESSGEL